MITFNVLGESLVRVNFYFIIYLFILPNRRNVFNHDVHHCFIRVIQVTEIGRRHFFDNHLAIDLFRDGVGGRKMTSLLWPSPTQ